MAKLLKLRRGTTSQHSSFTGAEGEVTIDTDKDVPVVHDGSTAGGHPVAAEDLANVTSASIVGRIDAAALAGTKVSPDFGSQDITTTGDTTVGGTLLANGRLSTNNDYSYFQSNSTSNASLTLKKSASGADSIDYLQCRDSNNDLKFKIGGNGNIDVVNGIDVTGDVTTTGNLSISSAVPKIFLTDTGNNPDYLVKNQDGAFVIRDNTNNADRLVVQADGHVDVAGNLDVGAGVDVTGDSEFIGDVKFDSATAGRDIIFDRSHEKLRWEDNAVAAFGTSSDLQIYHDGSNSYIKDENDYLFISGNNGIVIKSNSSGTEENQIRCINGGAVELYYDNSKTLETTSTGVTVTGALTATGDVTAFSDQTLKKDITTINDALGLCGKLRGVSYKWIKDDKPSIGVIAQEIEQHIPEVVSTTQLDGADVKSVDYGKIVGVLINAINELKAELDQHKAEYADLTIEDVGNMKQEELNKLVLVQRKTS